MTVSSTTNRAQFNCNGSTTSFPFTFKYLADSDLQVYLSSPAGVVTLLTLNVDYEITPAVPGPGGTLSFLGTYLSSPPVSGYTLTILRFIARTQEVDFINGDSLDERNIEGMGDRITMMVQDLDERIGRAVTVPPTSGISNISVPDPVAGAFLRWNLSGNGLENATYVDPTLITISDYWRAVIDGGDTLPELATQAEVDAGTDDARIVTPKKLYATPGIYRKNAVINGDMRIAQRGTPLAGFTTSGYSLDMWQLLYGGGSATLTISRETAVPSGAEFSNSLKILVTTADNSVAAGDNCCIVTKIEGYDARKFYAKTATLSFWVSSPKTGVHSVAFRNGTQNVSYCADYTVNQANTWEYKTITLTINGPGTWDDTTGCGIIISWALMVGSNYTQAPGSWVSANKLMSSNQSANILDTVNNAFYLTGVQFEIGSVATPFEFRHYGTELTLCQRYYEVGISAPHLCGAYTASYIIVNRMRFAVLKRTAPTVVYTAVSFLGNMGTGQALYSAGEYVDSLAPIYSTTAATAGDVGNVTLSWTATAEL